MSISSPAFPDLSNLAPSSVAWQPHLASEALAVGLEKTRVNITRLADEPKSAAFAVDGNYFAFHEGFFEIGNWTSSFFTGSALLSFERTRDTYFLQQVGRLADDYTDKITRHRMDTMHDLGFLYSLYSVPLVRLTGDPAHRRVALLAADELAKRFSPAGGYIQAWGRMDDPNTEYAGLAIIDCMMNLPLLFWASKETGNKFYREVAIHHADTTLAVFVRPDDSVNHAFRFDRETGAPLRPDNYCGFAVDSHWARGTSWGIYGFAIAARYTGESRYLEASRRLAAKFISLLDDELVPVWDFRLPDGDERLRDSSAAAVAVCGFQELLQLRPEDAGLQALSDALLMQLCSDEYLDRDTKCPGLLRKGQVGDGVGRARYAYTSWGDYYLMEALSRRLHNMDTYW